MKKHLFYISVLFVAAAAITGCSKDKEFNNGKYGSPGLDQKAIVPPQSANGKPNLYDGLYEVNGTFKDVSNALYTASYPRQYYLVTTGPASVHVEMAINKEVTQGYLFKTATGTSFYGNFGLQVFFDAATHKVKEVRNYFGDPSNKATIVGNPSAGTGAPGYASVNGRSAVLDNSGENAYNPASKVVKIKYFMLQPSVVPVGARCFFDETWTYIGPRL